MRKKSYLCAISLLCSVFLIACSNNQGQESTATSSSVEQVTSESSSTTSSSEQKSISLLTLDIDTLMQGNYDSIIGTWQNSQGEQLTFNIKGLVSETRNLIGRGKITVGIFETGFVDKNTGESGLLMVPANFSIPSSLLNGGEDLSDTTKDRMVIATEVLDTAVDVFYRVSNSANSGLDPLSNTQTGVTLDSGPKTIEYANQILGENNWQVVEGNYTRTESIPYNILEGNDKIRYTVYQNGIIINANYQIVYQP
ncbi:DUF6287 domain-containing protein [Streptococcus suis]